MFRRTTKHAERAEDDQLLLEAEVEVVFAIRAAGKGDIYWGAPTRCPACGVYGFVDEVDHQRGSTKNRCLTRDCGNEWVVTRRAVREMKRRKKAAIAGAAVGTGIEGMTPIPTASPLFARDGEDEPPPPPRDKFAPPSGGRGRGMPPPPASPSSTAGKKADPLDRFDQPSRETRKLRLRRNQSRIA